MDMVKMTDDQLADLARSMFLLGMLDARTHSGRLTRYELADVHLRKLDHCNGHTFKLRQVYGAGYDIEQLHERIRRVEKEAA